MKKILALVLALFLFIAVFAAADTLAPFSEEEAIAFLEELTDENVIFAEYGEDDTLVFIGAKCGRLNRTWRDEYFLDDLKNFAEKYSEGALEELPPVTGKLNELLTEDAYEVMDLLNVLDVKLLPVITAWEPVEFSFEGLTFEVYPNEELEVATEEVILHAYYLETVKVFVD